MRYLCLPILLLSTGLAQADLLYSIGNSLTADAKPWALGPDVGYHIDYGETLDTIHAKPNGDGPINVRPATWDVALATHDYDYLSIQPYDRSKLRNVPEIEDWMSMQPDAVIILHTPWPPAFGDNSAEMMAQFELQYHDHMNQDDATLISALRTNNPTRDIRETHSGDALDGILHDIQDGLAPDSLLFSDIYRIDQLHMSDIGDYLMHNLLAASVNRPMANWQQLGLNGAAVDSEVWTYLDSQVVEFFPNAVGPAPVPEPSSLLLLSILGGGFVAKRRLRRGRKTT